MDFVVFMVYRSQNNRKHDSECKYKFTMNNSIVKQEQIYALI